MDNNFFKWQTPDKFDELYSMRVISESDWKQYQAQLKTANQRVRELESIVKAQTVSLTNASRFSVGYNVDIWTSFRNEITALQQKVSSTEALLKNARDYAGRVAKENDQLRDPQYVRVTKQHYDSIIADLRMQIDARKAVEMQKATVQEQLIEARNIIARINSTAYDNLVAHVNAENIALKSQLEKANDTIAELESYVDNYDELEEELSDLKDEYKEVCANAAKLEEKRRKALEMLANLFVAKIEVREYDLANAIQNVMNKLGD
jgi:hypothetical protein